MFDTHQFDGAAIRSVYLGFAGAEGCSVLANSAPDDGAAAAADNEARQTAEFEEFDGSAVGDGVSKLATPACVAEGGEFVTFCRGRRSGIRVGFFVMVVREMIECLKGGGTVRVVRNAIVGSGIQIFQGMNGSLVVLGTGGI